MFFEFGFDESQREAGTDEWNVLTLAQDVRHSSNVVFMSVSQHDGDNVIPAIANVGEIGKNQVHARL